MFVKFKLVDGKEIYINPDKVLAIRKSSHCYTENRTCLTEEVICTMIDLGGEDFYKILESIENVIHKLNGEELEEIHIPVSDPNSPF